MSPRSRRFGDPEQLRSHPPTGQLPAVLVTGFVPKAKFGIIFNSSPLIPLDLSDPRILTPVQYTTVISPYLASDILAEIGARCVSPPGARLLRGIR